MSGFLNRRRHLDRLSELLNGEATQGNSIVVASGAPGVGKSALLREAATSVSSRYCYVYCDRQAEGVPGGLPLPELLQRRLSVLAKENGFASFDVFCSDKQWFKTFVRAGEAAGLVVAKSVLPGMSADFVVESYQQARTALGKWNRKTPASLNLDDQRLIYALSIFETIPSIIHIDHAQHLDDNELEILLHLAGQTKAVLFLEYASNRPFSPSDIPAQLAQLPVLALPIERLEIEYADRLFASLPERFSTFLREQFIKSGDLRPFDQAVAMQSRKKNILEIFDITEDNLQRTIFLSLNNLDDVHQRLLIAISAHAGPVERAFLQEFIDSLPPAVGLDKKIDVESAIDRFDDSLLVISTATDVMCQARVNDKVDQEPRLSAIKLTFRKLWRDFYRDLPAKQLFVSDEERCRQLLHQCAELSDFVGIARTLEEVGRRGISSRNPRSIVSYLQGVIEKLKFAGDRQAMSRIALSQCLFFYKAGWFDEALACLSMVEEKSRRYQYLLAELYCSTEHQDRGIRLAQGYLNQLDSSEKDVRDAELCLRLIILHGLRNSNQLKEARDYYLAMTSNRRYADLNAFPILLRYADMCLYKEDDHSRCIDYLTEAAAIAKDNEQWEEFASVCLSLVQHLGYTDALDRVDDYLREVENIAQELWLQQATLLTNRAVLSMYRGISDTNDCELLKQALVLSYDPLDRILIQTNLLAWHATAGDLEGASRSAAPLYRFVQNTSVDTEIRRIALYNLEQIERLLGNQDKAQELFKIWSALDSGIDVKYWQFRRNEIPPPSSSFRRYQMKFHPVFLANWHTGLVPFNAISDDA